MINRISHKQFLDACNFALDKVEKENGKPVVIVVADEAGDIVHMMHMDGAPARSGIIASGKAFTAAKMQRTTTALGEYCTSSNTSLSAFVIEGMTTMPGGTPIVDKKGAYWGAVGVSGRSAAEDQLMADTIVEFLVK